MNAQVKEHFIKAYGIEKTVDLLFDVIDAIPVSVFIKNEKLEKIFANKANLELDERTLGDTLGYTDFDIHTAENAAIFAAEDRAVLIEGKVRRNEESKIRKDGVRVDFLTYKNRIDVAGGEYLLVGANTITDDLKNRERQLAAANAAAQSNRKDLQEILDAMPLGITIIAPDMKVVTVNEANKRFWNLDRSAVFEGMPYADMVRGSHKDFPELTRDEWETNVERCLAEALDGNVAPREERGIDGQMFIFSSVKMSNGNRLTSCFDMTGQKKNELALIDAERKAILADRAKSEFLANMSHEIRTPMNGVLGMAELLARTELDPKQKTFTDIIVKSGNALLTIINDILDFSKIDAGQLTLDPAPFRLAEAIEDVATLISARAQEKDLELIVRVAPGLPEYVVGDVGRLRQIVTNLMGNAVKFTESGHVLVDVTGQADPSTGLASLQFKITDTGIGIPQEKLRQVFEKFSQVDTSSTRRHEGTGLGLAISTKLVALMGGQMGASSEPGKGSAFWFTITVPVHGAAVRKKLLPFDVDGARVLIIDDNPVNRSILLEQMRSWHFDACAATGGREGIAVLSQAKALGLDVDVLILDYHMPDLNGADVARIIRSTPALADMAVILLTSVDTAMQGAEFDGVKINAHLMKPARSSLLFDTIVNVIREARPQAHEPAMPDVPKGLGEPGVRMETDTAAYAPSGLPAAPAAAIVAAAQEAAAKLDILVAEDNAVNQIVFTQILEGLPYRYEIADNGRKAFEAMKARRPAIILMDVSMPEMNGMEATIAIRGFEAANSLTRTPIIGVTAHALKGDRERCVEAGMDDYLSKPISPDMLEAKINIHMAKLAISKQA